VAAGASWPEAFLHVTLPCTLLHSYPGQQYAGRSGLVAPQATARFPALDRGDAQISVLPIACAAISAAHWSRTISTRSRIIYIHAISMAHGGKGVPSSHHYQINAPRLTLYSICLQANVSKVLDRLELVSALSQPLFASRPVECERTRTRHPRHADNFDSFD